MTLPLPGSTEAISPLVVCDNCRSSMVAGTKVAVCINCKRTASSENGYLDFMSQPNEYWGEISREDASDALELGYKYGASEALAHLCEKYPGLDEYLLSWARSDGVFHWLSSKTSTESCVELGSGWGSLTLGLSKYFDQMIS